MNADDAAARLDASLHQRYAALLFWGSRLSFVFLVASFYAYLSKALPSRVAPEHLGLYWDYPLDTFLERTNTPIGWEWLRHAACGELASLTGIAILASCSAPCLLAVSCVFLRRKDRIYASLCVLQVVIMTLAASGILG